MVLHTDKLEASDLEAIAAGLGIETYNAAEVGHDRQGRRKLDFTLRPVGGSDTYRRRSASVFQVRKDGTGRRIWAVCWHGHRDFMREVFRLDPAARLKSVMADYDGAADFEASFEYTGHRNIGSMMYPVAAREACDCE